MPDRSRCTVSASGFLRRSMPRISAPICVLSGTTSSFVLVMTFMGLPPGNQVCVIPPYRRVRRRPAMLDLAARERGEDLLDQLARGLRAELHRDTLTPALGLVDEVDAECVVERRVKGVIVVDVGGIDPHPAVRSLGAAQEPGLLDDV